MVHPSYTMDRYQRSQKLSLIFIPFQGSCKSSMTSCFASPTMIPALLYVNTSGKANRFCINFHGNACDVGQIALCAEKEGRALNAHYLLVEYPRFGVADGHPNEVTLNQVSLSVHSFVLREFDVKASEIILLGRSIGTGPVCELASELTKMNQAPAAVILQSPYSSIRDVTYDLLGCVNFFLLDRWQNWRKLVGSIEDPSVIKCPVLFIHADGDKVINYHHSLLMHEYRVKCGLPSELFVQKSDAHFVKGHNFFDYDRDVVVPSVEFMTRVAQKKFQINAPIASGTNTLHASTSSTTLETKEDTPSSTNNHTPRIITLKREALEHFSVIPAHFQGRFTQEQDLEFKGNSSIFKSLKCTYDVYMGWCCCPCSFCAECNVAWCYNSMLYVAQRTCCVPVFDYQSLRPAGDPSKNTLFTALFRPAEFGKSVREDEAASSAGKRQQKQFASRSFSNSKKDNTSVTNPLLSATPINDTLHEHKTGSKNGSNQSNSGHTPGGSSNGSNGSSPVNSNGVEFSHSGKLDYVPG